MTVYSYFEGVVNLSDPVVPVTIVTTSGHLHHHLHYYISVSYFLFEIPKAVYWHVRVLWRVDCGWRDVRGMPEGKSGAAQPQSLDHRLEKQHILFQSQTCLGSVATEKPCLPLGCLCGHGCHRDPGDTGRTSSMAAASHTPQTLTLQLFLHVCDH